MRKISSNKRGFAMVVALLAFTILFIIGSTILTVAYSNYVRTQKKVVARQNELYVLSAAEAFRDGLEGATIKQENISVIPDDGSEPELTVSYHGEYGVNLVDGDWRKSFLMKAYQQTHDTFDMTIDDDIEVDCSMNGFIKGSDDIIDDTSPIEIYVSYNGITKKVLIAISHTIVTNTTDTSETVTHSFTLKRATISDEA